MTIDVDDSIEPTKFIATASSVGKIYNLLPQVCIINSILA